MVTSWEFMLSYATGPLPYILVRRFPTMAYQDAQDACSEALLRAWSMPSHARLGARWLKIVATNIVIDAYRRRPLSDVPIGVWHDAVPDNAPDMADALAMHDETARVLAACTPDERNLLRRVYLDGETFAGIAALDALPIPTVKARAQRAHARLRAAFGVEHAA